MPGLLALPPPVAAELPGVAATTALPLPAAIETLALPAPPPLSAKACLATKACLAAKAGLAAVGEGEAGGLVDGALSLVAVLRVRWEWADDEAQVLSAVDLEGRYHRIVATTLHSIFAPKVAREQAELATRHVHADPDVHVYEVPEEGGRILAGRESETRVAGGVLSEGAVVQVASEVR